MMRIDVRRFYFSDTATLGILTTGKVSLTTLEDAKRDHKIKGETCIPAGTYKIKLRKKSGMANAYRERYGSEHEGMIWLQNVPEFEYVYIHTGNGIEDTAGCILVGRTMDVEHEVVGASREAYRALYPGIMDAIARGEDVEITITDCPPV